MANVSIPGVGVVQFPESMSEDDIAATAKRLHDQAHGVGPGTPNLTGTPMFPHLIAPQDRADAGVRIGGGGAPVDLTGRAPKQQEKPSDWRDAALDLLVGLTGTGSGLAGATGGPLLGIAAAGAGAHNASILADIARTKMGTARAPKSWRDAETAAVVNGAIAGGGQGLGEAFSLGAPRAAASLARRAFPKNMSQTYMNEWGRVLPTPWETMLADPEFPPVGRSAVAGENALTSSRAAKSLEASNPNTYNPEDLLGVLDAEIARMERISTTPGPDVAELRNLRDQWIKGNVPELPPPPTIYDQHGNPFPAPEPEPRVIRGTDLAESKRFAQRRAQQAYNRGEGGAALRASAPNEQLYNKALAQQIRARLGADVPGLNEQDATTRYWSAAEAALQEAEKHAPRPFSLSQYVLSGGAGSALSHSPQGALYGAVPLALADRARDPFTLSLIAKFLASKAGPESARALGSALGIPGVVVRGAMSPRGMEDAPDDSTDVQQKSGGGFVKAPSKAFKAPTPFHANYLTWDSSRLRSEMDALGSSSDFASRAMRHAYGKRLKEIGG